jgi:hypothetical protein
VYSRFSVLSLRNKEVLNGIGKFQQDAKTET